MESTARRPSPFARSNSPAPAGRRLPPPPPPGPIARATPTALNRLPLAPPRTGMGARPLHAVGGRVEDLDGIGTQE